MGANFFWRNKRGSEKNPSIEKMDPGGYREEKLSDRLRKRTQRHLGRLGRLSKWKQITTNLMFLIFRISQFWSIDC